MEPGLWPETTGVVQFWSKPSVKVACPTCNASHNTWEDGTTVQEAEALAERLNKEGFDKELIE
jgi:hypothetical protein